ncbi:hypothetical protein M231_05041 [Tremella mesenterica]|uniref:HMA domain-containing protein n=1 Tax=Tremella mesenterica TaxID=5217 RepID=A0A4Q1BJ50_TREME|nr:hypothetical protein M231_05041 [Tremella mesenterica]
MSLPLHNTSHSLLIPNMHCPSCVEHITSLLSTLTYVRDISISLLLQTVTFRIVVSENSVKNNKTEIDLVKDVARVLYREGGFEVDSTDFGILLSLSSSRKKDRVVNGETRSEGKGKKGWISGNSWSGWYTLMGWKGTKKGLSEEERRKLHLEHCPVCRDSSNSHGTSRASPAQNATTTTTLMIEGMTCSSCSSTITRTLQSTPGVISVHIDLFSNKGEVVHTSQISPEDICELVEDLGYGSEVVSSVVSPEFIKVPDTRSSPVEMRKSPNDPYSLSRLTKSTDTPLPLEIINPGNNPQHGTPQRHERTQPQLSSRGSFMDGKVTERDDQEEKTILTTLSVEGITCASCTTTISNVLNSIKGSKKVNVDLLANKADVEHLSSVIPEDIKEAIEDVGYGAEVVSSIPRPVPTFISNPKSGRQLPPSASRDASDASEMENENILEQDESDLGQNEKITRDEGVKEIVGKGQNKNVGEEKKTRTIQVKVEGIYCSKCTTKLNNHLSSLPLHFTPFDIHKKETKITYEPRNPFTIRDILKGLSDLSPEFEAVLIKTQGIQERSREIQKREARRLAINLMIAVVFAIPTFIIAIIGMVLLPSHNHFRMLWMSPRWGAANLGTIILFPLSTVVQFGVGRIFYQRAFGPVLARWYRRAAHSHRRNKMRNGWKWKSLVTFGSMDLLVALSTSVSYFASIAMLIIDVRAPSTNSSVGTYFDSCVFLIMFILLGRVLEALAKSKTMDAVEALGKMRAGTALLLESTDILSNATINGDTVNSFANQGQHTRTIPIDQVEIGDHLIVPPGSSPPTDGYIISGHTTIDESSLTGESLPIPKSPGDEIYTGTINLSSPIVISVKSIGQTTMLEKIISAVSTAGGGKTPLEHLAERLTGYFVPFVVYLSLIVMGIWLSLVFTGKVNGEDSGGKVFFSLEFGISVLVVACPCGIGLAVPCANAVGSNLAARKGILAVSGGEGWNEVGKVGVVICDKTGTLTMGKASVVDEWSYETNWEMSRKKEMEMIIRCVEERSTHPLAKGITEYISTKYNSEDALSSSNTNFKTNVGTKVELSKMDEIAGKGIRAMVNLGEERFEVLTGNQRLLEVNDVEMSPEVLEILGKWGEQAFTSVLVAVRPVFIQTNSIIITAYALSDPLRPQAKEIIERLRLQVKIIICTGDRKDVALSIARQLDIDPTDVRAGVGPEEKANVVDEVREGLRSSKNYFHKWKKLQVRGTGKGKGRGRRDKVMFVGDGINDAVALTAADVGVAMGGGSEVAVAGADFILLNSSLSSLPTLIRLSTQISNRQKLNLAWACIFNIVCIPFAAGVFYSVGLRLSPVWSAVLMALSSVSVVCSSLALRWTAG